MPTFYATSRRRTLTGLGRTFFVRPGLRGMGDDTTDLLNAPLAAPGTLPLPAEQPAPPPPLPASFFTMSAPWAPVPANVPPTPPVFAAPAAPVPFPGTPSTPAAVQIVLPSQGPIAPAAPAAAAASSWFDQQAIPGIKNLYLALGMGGAILFLSMSKRRR